MNTKKLSSRMGIIGILIILVLGFPSGSVAATPAGTAFTYQGQLTQGGEAVTGSCDFHFSLWDDPSAGSQVPGTTTLVLPGVTVTNGLFTVQLDFGASVFSGEARWLEIGVKCAGDLNYTTLAPRQPMTPAPYALYAPTAGNATNATTVTNGVYTSGSYANPTWLTALAGSKISGTVANATTVTNGVYTSGSYANPTWLTALAGSKISGTVANATTVTNGVYTSGSYANPAWLTALAGSKISGTVASATNATSVTNGVYTSGSYANPAWLTELAGSKITGTVTSATNATNFSGTLSGDVSGTQGSTSVIALRGVAITSTAPADRQVLQYNGLQWAPSSALDGLWSLTGNSNTNVLTNFLGTTNNMALEFRVYNNRALRLEPNATSPNILGGYSGNGAMTGVIGAVIGGGGSYGFPNSVTDNYGVVGGGGYNQAGDNAGTTSDRTYATVGGGLWNTASADTATVGGGYQNTASGGTATVGGGSQNIASGAGAFIGGGGFDGITYSGNTAAAKASTIGGGLGNQVNSGANYATVPGGLYAVATHFGEMAHASGDFANPGDAQTSEFVLRNTTTNTTQTELFLDGASARITLASARTLSFDILIVAHSSTGGSSAGYQIKGQIENEGGTTAFVGMPVVTVLGEDVAAWDAVAVADDVNDALVIKVTGAASTTIRWVTSVRTVEVGW